LRRRLDGSPVDHARALISAEFGLTDDDVDPPVAGDALYVGHGGEARRQRLHPVLFDLRDGHRLTLDPARMARRWAWPGEIDQLDTAPGLTDALRRVYA